MADPITWGALPKAQDDNTTVDEAIAAAITAHNDDNTSHLLTGQSLEEHRTADVLDHPDLSVQAGHLTDDIAGVGKKAGTFAFVGDTWAAVASAPAQAYKCGCYMTFSTPLYLVFGDSGAWAYSLDADTWTAGAALTGHDISSAAFGGGVGVIGGSGASGAILLHSSDGSSWTPVTITGADHLINLFFDGTQFVALVYMTSGSPVHAKVYTSTDGVSWSGHSQSGLPELTYLGGDAPTTEYVGYAFPTIYSSLDLDTWTSRLSGTNNPRVQDLISAGGLSLADYYYDFQDLADEEIVIWQIAISNNGIGWGIASLPISFSPAELIFVAENYVAFTFVYPGWTIAVTGNGQIWQFANWPSTANPSLLFASPTKIVSGDDSGSAESLFVSELP